MILFENIIYKTREISLSTFGNVIISENVLNKKLLDESGAYVSEDALFIDEQIFFFVDSNQFQLSDVALAKVIMKSIK